MSPSSTRVPLSWPLVGRREELALCEASLREGTGVVVAGAAGVGKTRLVTEAIAAAAAGCVTARAWGSEVARTIPLGALSHLLPAEASRAPTTFDLLRQARAALGAPSLDRALVLAVDDAHLLDAASAVLVQQLVAGRRATVFATIRAGEPVPDAVTALWKDHGCAFVELQPLSRAESGAVLELVLGGQLEGRTEHLLWEASRGTPLMLRELVLDGLDRGVLAEQQGLWVWRGELGTGRRLRELVAARIGEVDNGGRDVLETAALGEPVPCALFAELAAVDALVGRGVLEARRDGRRLELRFAHPLHAEVVRATIPPTRAVRIWRRLSDFVEANGVRRRGDVLRLATWRLESGDDAPAELLVRAARLAELASTPVLAERLARAAERGGGGFAAGFVAARALAAQGRLGDAERALERLAREAVGDVERAMVAEARARNLAGGLGWGSEALAVVAAERGAIVDPTWRAKLALAEAWVRFRLGAPAEAVEIVEPALLEDPAVEPGVRLSAVAYRTQMLAITGRAEEAVALLERWSRDADVSGEVAGVPAATSPAYAIALMAAGRMPDAEAVTSELYEVAVDRDDLELLGLACFLRGLVALHRGRVAPALKWLRESVGVMREGDPAGLLPWALALVAQAAGQARQAGEARSAATAAAEAASRTSDSWIYTASIELGRAWASAAEGALAEARAAALAGAEMREKESQFAAAFIDFHDLARLGGAAVAAPRLERLVARVEGPWVRACAAHAAALAARDAPRLRAAAVEFEGVGTLLFAAEAMSEAAVAFREAGRSSSAHACAARARALLEHCPGARVPTLLFPKEFEDLTRREREIASLAAGGLSNKNIATRLTLSVRTVENQLQRAYRKLGITSRRELSSLLDPHATQ